MKLTASVSLLLATASQAPSIINAAPVDSDPCAAIAGKSHVLPSQALACLKSFPYNETIKSNVISNAERVMDFSSFESFQDSSVRIRDELSRINGTKYESDYAFNRDLYDVTSSLNDGHTRWLPSCYLTFQNLVPTPIISLLKDGEHNVYIAPNAAEFVGSFGEEFTRYYDDLGWAWKPLAGAKVLRIANKDAYKYIDELATTQAGNYLDHGVRVNSLFTGYHIAGSTWSQRIGLLASRPFPDQDILTMRVNPVNSTSEIDIKIPFYAAYLGAPFTDKATYWEANCAVKNSTNGVNRLTEPLNNRVPESNRTKLQPIAEITQDRTTASAIGLPREQTPTIPPVAGSAGPIKSYILPDGKTGAIYVSTFAPDDFDQFQYDIESAVKEFTSKGVTKLIIDLHNNGGGYVCLGHFLTIFLAGRRAGYPGFESTIRANELSKKIVASNIKLGLNSSVAMFAPGSWAFPNGTLQPADYNYVDPSAPFSINGTSDPISQRLHDTCESSFVVEIPGTPAFEPENIALVGNGNCASTCALFSTLMYERLNTKIATFGGRDGQPIEFKGTAGNQVLDWPMLDSEIKTAGLKDDPLAPPDLIIDGNFRVNWRSAWSWVKREDPIAFLAQPPQFHLPYTNETYNNPQNLWIYSASVLFSNSTS